MDRNVNLLKNLFILIKGIYSGLFSCVDLKGTSTYELSLSGEHCNSNFRQIIVTQQ